MWLRKWVQLYSSSSSLKLNASSTAPTCDHQLWLPMRKKGRLISHYMLFYTLWMAGVSWWQVKPISRDLSEKMSIEEVETDRIESRFTSTDQITPWLCKNFYREGLFSQSLIEVHLERAHLCTSTRLWPYPLRMWFRCGDINRDLISCARSVHTSYNSSNVIDSVKPQA